MEKVKEWFQRKDHIGLDDNILSHLAKHIEKSGLNYANVEKVLSNNLEKKEMEFIDKLEKKEDEDKKD